MSIMVSFFVFFGLKMVNCPKCGKSLVKGSRNRYYCENEDCPVIFVRCPCESFATEIAVTSLADEKTLEKLEKVTAKRDRHVS
jgi:DNA-binding transcriptional regulator GbsR (MarR family)